MNLKLLRQIIIMSKYTLYGMILQVFCLSLLFAETGKAQNESLKDIRLTVNWENARLKKVFHDLNTKTGFKFNFHDAEINVNKKVTLNLVGNSMDEVLRILSKQANLKFRRVNSNIHVGKKEFSQQPVTEYLAYADVDITGKITDENGEGLPGASVVVKGTSNGTTTNIEGDYKITVPDYATLVISFVGYKTTEIELAGRSVIDIRMLLDAEQLEEIVVIGYGGEVNKKDLTGAVSSANLEAALETSNVSIVQALQGSIAGLNVGAVTNAGQNPSLSVRGQATLSSGSADNAPLIVLDGIIYRGNIVDINPSDIESIDILKDASSAAIYGSQASNGVIVITSKSGNMSSGKPKISLSSSYTLQTPSNKFEPMNAAELEEFYPDIFWGEPEGSRLGPDFLQVNPDFDFTRRLKTNEINQGHADGLDTPWYDLLTGNGHVSAHNISIAGQNESVNYFVSGGFTDQAAFIKNDEYKRYNFRGNMDIELNDWLNIGTQTFVAVSDYSGIDAGDEIPFYLQPWAPIRDSEGELIPRPEGGWFNPFLRLEQASDSDTRLNLSSVMYADIDIPMIEGLSYRVNYANNYRTQDERRFIAYEANFTGEGYQKRSQWRDWMLDNIVTYKKTFGEDHNINATLVYGVEERDISSLRGVAQNFSVDLLGYNRLQAGDPTLNEITTTKEKESSLYQMGRLLYNYKNKYYFTGTIRRDGFSGFGDNDKTAVFPSMALGWVISEESFGRNVPWLNFLKLRTSYGQSGRRGVGRYATRAQVSTGPSVVFGDGGQTFQGQSVSSLANPALSWETTTGLDIGLDFEVINSRVRGNLDFYTNRTKDILFAIQLPEITGFEEINSNIAEVSNHGIELTLSSTIVDNGSLRWDASANFNRVRNKIESILGADVDNDGVEDDLVGNQLFIGEPQSVVYDYEIIGMWQLADQADNSIWPGFFPGTYKLNDLNGDDDISSLDDRKILGYRDPSYRFGVSNTLSYKNFSLYVFVNSIQGGKNYYMGDDAPHSNGSWEKRDQLSYSNVPKGAWDYWMPENPNAKYRRLDQPSNFEATPYSQRSFVRLQDVSLSYNFPTELLEKLNINRLKVFLSGKNLATWTNWKGQDPETGVGFRPDRPVLRSYTMGLNLEF